LEIDLEEHAFVRLTDRSCQFGLDIYEALERVTQTISESKLSKSKYSRCHLIYYKYFHDNLSFFVVCRKCKKGFVVKTVIITEGRE
jgi:hypothetical protein